MSEGITVKQECQAECNKLKTSHTYRYVLMKITDMEVVVESTAEPSTSYQEFVDALPDDDCRYAVYDFEYQEGGARRSKPIFVQWAPDAAKIKSKMNYATAASAVKSVVGREIPVIRATDKEELQEKSVREGVQAKRSS